jgi:hypothetical protein
MDTLEPDLLDGIIMAMPHLVDLSQVFQSRNDEIDLEDPTSPASQAVDEVHQQRDEKPSLGFDFLGHTLGLGQSSKTMLRANTGGIFEALGCKRRKDTSENNSTDPEAYTPGESDGSLSAVSCRERCVSTPGIVSDLERLEFGDIEERSTSEDTASFAGTPGEDLLEMPWFHQNVRRVLRGLLQRWQGFRTAARVQHGAQSTTTTQRDLEAHQQGSGRGSGKRRREQAGSGDEADQGEPSISRLKRARKLQGSPLSRPFSCPFCKKDLQRYQACAKFGLTRVPHVKQHLHRKHRHEIDDLVKNRLKQRSARGTEEEQWYGIFDLLFPGHSPRPASPYNDFTLSEQPPQTLTDGVPIDEALYIPGVLLTTESIEVLHQSLVEDPVFADVRPEDIRRALDRGLSQAYMDQMSRPVAALQAGTQQSFERENTDSEQSSNTQVSEWGRDLSSTDPSDECEVVNEHPRLSQLDPIPTVHLEKHWNSIEGDPQQQEFPHEVHSPMNGPTHDQQQSVGDQVGLGGEPGLSFSFTEDQPPPVSEWDHLFDLDSLLGPSIEDSWRGIDEFYEQGIQRG